MPGKKSDKAILAEIRQVIRDMDENFMIRNYEEGDDPGSRKGHKMREPLAVEIIRDLANGTEEPLTRDYKRTKAEKAAAVLVPK